MRALNVLLHPHRLNPLNPSEFLARGNRPIPTVLLFLALILTGSESAFAAEIKPLWLSLAPAKSSTLADFVICEVHGIMTPEQADQMEKPPTAKGRPGRKPGAAMGASGGWSGKPPEFESEHRPKPVRNYWLNLTQPTPDLEVSAMAPDGSRDKVELKSAEKGLQLALFTPMGEGSGHGAHNVYVVDRQVVDNVLEIRTAKWLTIHHSCGWGHDHRYNEQRQSALTDEKIPFEIVIPGLWDFNFHSTVMSGDELNIQVASYGKPVVDAKLTVTSSKGWEKTLATNKNGHAEVQLIRDYYPSSWQVFNRDKKSAFKVMAVYEKDEQGTYKDSPYERIKMTSTFGWRYYPARQDYHSYAWGLGIALIFSLGSGVGIYAYRERRRKPHRGIVFDE